MAIEYPFIAGKPFPALPDVTFRPALINDCHPPIIENKNYTTDHPFNKDPANVYHAEE